jgi:hypothetical protein
MERSNEIDQLASALVKAQAEFSAVPKDSNNPFFKSKYAALPDVVKHTAPVLAKHGLAVSQFISDFDTLTTYLLHESGQFISHSMKLHLVADKNDVITPQAQGSAVTYARRYSYMAALGVVADDDDDGNSASQSYARQAPAPAQAPRQSNAQSLGNAVAAAAQRPAPAGVASQKMVQKIWAISHKALGWNDVQTSQFIQDTVGHCPAKLDDLSFDDAKTIIEALESVQQG